MGQLSGGVYFILNRKSRRFYVGSTKCHFVRRWKAHIIDLEKGRHHCQPLQRAINKYSYDDFYFLAMPIDANKRLEIEQIIINEFNKQLYNTCKIAGCPNVVLSKESRHKISVAMSNRTISQETKNRISKTLTGRNRGKEFSKECSERLKGKPLNIPEEKMFRGKKVQRIDTGEIFISATSASKSLGFANNSVTKSILRNRKSGGTFWKYI
jgi:group I intron endonuclease